LETDTVLTFNTQIFQSDEYPLKVQNLSASAHSLDNGDIIRFQMRNLNPSSKTLEMRALNDSQQITYGTTTVTVRGPLGDFDGDEY
jgi:hypothetical protein